MPLRVECVQFLQESDSVGDTAVVGRLDERERRDVAEAQGRHPEDDGGQIGSQDLRFGELVAGVEVVLAVEPDADTRSDAAATPRPLVGRCLRDVLDRKPLDLGAGVVTGDAGLAGVDDIADPGHRHRRFCDVGGQHDPAPLVGAEHAVLFGRREPGVQREDLGGRQVQLRQRLGRFPDLPLSGQEDQHVAGTLAGQCPDRIGDGLRLRHRQCVVTVG